MHLAPVDESEDDDGVLRDVIVAVIGIVVAIWLPNLITTLIFNNQAALMGTHILRNNFYMFKYYLI